jgi:hypothetical protein
LAKPGAVEEQNLQRALSLPEKYKQRAAASRATDTFFNQSAQPVKSPSQINGLQADEDLDTARDHERSPHAVVANASSTTDNASRSASAPTSTRACPICTTIDVVLGAGRALRFRTTRASRTVFFASEALPARFKLLDHQYSVVAEYSRSSQYWRALSPLARHASTSAAQSLSFDMHGSLGPARARRYTPP